MFLEFPGASGGPVFINVDCIAQISVGSPRSSMSGVFFDPIRVTFKPGYGEGLIDEFMIDDDYVGVWVRMARQVLCGECAVEPEVASDGEG